MSGFLLLLVLMAQLTLAPIAVAAPRPPSLAQLFDQALAASREGSIDQALPLWNQVLEMAPQDAAAWSNRGNVRLVLGDPLAAIADQERAMALEPANPEPHLNRGIAEEALQRWGAAETDYRWILEPPATPAAPAAGYDPEVRPRPSTTSATSRAARGTGRRRARASWRRPTVAPALPWPDPVPPWRRSSWGSCSRRSGNFAP